LLLLCLSPSFGGLEMHVRDYALFLHRQGTRLCLALREDSPLHRALAHLPCPIWLTQAKASKWPWRLSGNLAAFARQHSISHVHSHDQRDLPLSRLLKSRWRGRWPVKWIYTRHMGLAGSKKNPYHGWIYGGLDALIAVSDWVAADARRYLPISADKVQRVWPGVPPTVREGQPDTFSVGLLGRILPDKGQHRLVAAAAQCLQPITVVLAGQIHDETYWQQVQQQAQQACVPLVYLGVVPPAVAFARMSVAVNASRAEAFGLATVEAMRAGVPVVAARRGANIEILREEVDGLLFDDETELAQQLQRLQANPALAQTLATSAQARAAECFDAERQFGVVWGFLIKGETS
jgi:glycosyltransferase involved in cell wall biosynthesis